ncbi:longitudinals lacking protein, isoforms A/B/D/L-like [Diaphorina citri]|uniref:Longitudinals lacking protein, isoforms A/B/D/L-like n=1 Tax=Diaphorina citri TaxID=121845 RepID=A0A1S3DJG3_DIACI|nr:longitudinals lacking protein, isoforms A/B/D/L-like [Diaphorina citri]
MAISQRYLEKIVTNGPTNNNNPLQSIAAAQLAHAQNILLQDYYESGSDTSETNNSHPSSRQRRSKTIRDKDDVILPCDGCGKKYRSKTSLSLHKRLECGKEPAFKCPFCPLKTHQKGNLQVHMKKKHNQDYYTGVLNLSTSLFNGNAGGGNENALSITPPKISSSS